MNVLVGFLTVIMFFNCVVLIFLVLLQLPKKEAGAGMAFGGAATDALFGAGSGNALTNITKYSAGIFFGLALLMAIITAHQGKSSNADTLKNLLTTPAAGTHLPTTPAAAPSTAPATAPTSNFLQMTAPPTSTPKAEAPATTPQPAATNK